MGLQRLSRTEAILGADAVRKLQNAVVLIAGLGGVGGFALEALARCGVADFILIDYDKFEESNLNRQLFSTQENIGLLKVDVSHHRVNEIDKNIRVRKFPVFIDETNVDDFLNLQPTLVLDAIDSVKSKCLLLQKCYERKIPVVSSMGAALRCDATQVRVADISKTFGDSLAKVVRQNLKRVGIVSGIPCVFSAEKPAENLTNVYGECKGCGDGFTKSTDENGKIFEEDGATQSRFLGSLVTVTGTFGLVLAQTAVNVIIGRLN